MIKKIEGIVISEKTFKESSKLINILTEEGVVSLIAKGAKSLKSELRSTTTKLTVGDFTYYDKNKGLSTLTSADLKNSYKNIKKDIEQISYASYLLDLAEQVSKESDSKDIYKLLISSLNKIEEGFDPFVITNILELKYLDYLGVMPQLDSCSICGKKDSIVTLSYKIGGLVCKSCYKEGLIVNEKTIKLIRMYYYVDIDKISKLEVSDDIKKEINTFLDSYYDNYTGLYLKTKSFLKNLKKIIK